MSSDPPSPDDLADQSDPHPTAKEVIQRLENLWALERRFGTDSTPGQQPDVNGLPRADLLEQLAQRVADLISTGQSATGADGAQQRAELGELVRRTFPSLVPGDNACPEGPAATWGNAQRLQLGEFCILREIGRGGMGIVYEAEQLSLGRRVALKVLPFAAMLGKEQLNRFKNEARAAATLDHPNIVAIHSVGTDRGVHYYAMQLVEGCSLAHLIARMRNEEPMRHAECGVRDAESASLKPPSAMETSPLATWSTLSSAAPRRYYRAVAELGAQAARALDHAHANGVLHRDVKPANLLVDDQGKLWVTDFGLARIAAAPDVTMTGDVLGTLGYMSPEQALGRRSEVGERSDIYSLGATLYELATLRPLFGRLDRETLLHAIAHREPLRPRVVCPDMPRDLETILLKATAKEASQRYANALDMADDLDCFCKDQTIRARRPTVIDQLGKWSRRHQPLVITLMLALLLVSLVSATSALLINRARSTTRDALLAAEENAGRLAELLYATDMQLAYDAWDKGWPDQARLVLERQRPAAGELDRRGVAWQLLDNLTREPPSFALEGHQGAATELAIFPDGRRVASVGVDGIIRIWDVRTRELTSKYPLGDVTLHSVAVSGDGRFVAAGSHRLHLVDIERQEVRTIIDTESTIESLAFLADDKSIAVGSRYSQTDVVSLEGELLASIPNGARQESLHFLPETKRLLMPNRKTVNQDFDLGMMELISSDLGRVLRTWNPHDYDNVPRGNFAMGVSSPCERFVMLGDRYNARFVIGSVETGEQLASVSPLRSRMTSIAYSPAGDAVAAAFESGIVRIWKLESRNENTLSLDPNAQVMTAHHGESTCVRFLDSQTLITSGDDGVVRVWDLANQTQVLTLGRRDAVPFGLRFSPDGRYIGTACNTEFALYQATDGRLLFDEQRPRNDFLEIAWTPDSKTVAVASPESGRVELFDVATLNFVKEMHHGEHIDGIAISTTGRELASIGWNKLRVWELDSGRKVAEYSLNDYGYTVEYSSSGRWLAYAGRFNEITLRNVDRDRVEHQLNCPSHVYCLVFGPDDSFLVSGHADAKIRVWDLATGHMTAELGGHERVVQDLSLHPDGRTLVSSSADGTLRLWNLKLNRAIGVVHRCMNSRCVHVSPDGRWLAAGLSDDDGRRTSAVWPLSADAQ
jgi:WD40 repeat protein/serine/threonine protein kinase